MKSLKYIKQCYNLAKHEILTAPKLNESSLLDVWKGLSNVAVRRNKPRGAIKQMHLISQWYSGNDRLQCLLRLLQVINTILTNATEGSDEVLNCFTTFCSIALNLQSRLSQYDEAARNELFPEITQTMQLVATLDQSYKWLKLWDHLRATLSL